MKKNRMMRLASILLVCVLLTTSVISGTFAKYVTEVGSDDSARVAKWGFNTASITFEDLFASSYTNVASGSDAMAIIAPGTEGSVSFTFANALTDGPEVAYTFKVDTTGSECDTEIVTNNQIKWALVEGTGTETWGTFAELLAAINALDGTDGADGKDYEVAAIPGMVDKTYTIKWKWEFDDGTATKDSATNEVNIADTTLGNAAATATGDLAVTLKITITATQKD